MDAAILTDEIIQIVRVEVIAVFIIKNIVFVDAKREVLHVFGSGQIKTILFIELEIHEVIFRKFDFNKIIRIGCWVVDIY